MTPDELLTDYLNGCMVIAELGGLSGFTRVRSTHRQLRRRVLRYYTEMELDFYEGQMRRDYIAWLREEEKSEYPAG